MTSTTSSLVYGGFLMLIVVSGCAREIDPSTSPSSTSGTQTADASTDNGTPPAKGSIIDPPNPKADPLPEDIAVPGGAVITSCNTFRDEGRKIASTTISGQLPEIATSEEVFQLFTPLLKEKGWDLSDARGALGNKALNMIRNGRGGQLNVYSDESHAGQKFMIVIDEKIEP